MTITMIAFLTNASRQPAMLPVRSYPVVVSSQRARRSFSHHYAVPQSQSVFTLSSSSSSSFSTCSSPVSGGSDSTALFHILRQLLVDSSQNNENHHDDDNTHTEFRNILRQNMIVVHFDHQQRDDSIEISSWSRFSIESIEQVFPSYCDIPIQRLPTAIAHRRRLPLLYLTMVIMNTARTWYGGTQQPQGAEIAVNTENSNTAVNSREYRPHRRRMSLSLSHHSGLNLHVVWDGSTVILKLFCNVTSKIRAMLLR